VSLALIALFSLLYRFPGLGAKLVLLIFLWQTLVIELPSIRLGTNLFPPDIIFSLLFIVGLTRFILQQVRLTLLNSCWLVFGVLLFASFLRGILINGLFTAGVEFREFFYLWSGTLYFTSFSYQSISHTKWPKLWVGTATILLIIAIVRWITDGLGMSNWATIVGVSAFRVLNAGDTFFLAEAFSILLILGVLQLLQRWQWGLLSAFVFAILLLQHRTNWTITIVLVALVYLREPKSRIRLVSLSLGLLSLFLVASLIGSSFFGETTSKLESSLAESSSSVSANDTNSTFSWRIQGWQALLANVNTIPEYLLGKPFGSGFRRFVINRNVVEPVEVGPHNYYVLTFLRAGVIGLATLVFAYILILSKTHEHGNIQIWLEKRFLWFFVVMQLIFYITYPPGFEQSIVLGFALSYTQAYTDKKALTQSQGQ